MSLLGKRFRYSRWDGSQELPSLDADEIMSELSDDLMQFGDLRSAMRNLMQRGLGGDSPMQGLRDMLRQLRRERR